jgi:hypothetical protein
VSEGSRRPVLGRPPKGTEGNRSRIICASLRSGHEPRDRVTSVVPLISGLPTRRNQ